MEISKRAAINHFLPFLIYKFLKGFCFITSITFFVYFKDVGVDFFKASFLLSLLFFLPIFFELITGVFADTYGRKPSVLMGVAGEILIIFLMINVTSYQALVALFVLWGVVSTFTTGADDAWAMESIQGELSEAYIGRFYSLSASFYSFGMIFAGLLSSFLLSNAGSESIWIARIVALILMLVVLAMKTEKFGYSAPGASGIYGYIENFKKGINFFFNDSNSRNIIMGESFATIALVGIGSVAIQKYLLESGLKESYWGQAYSLTSFLGLFVPLFALYVARKMGSHKNYLVIVYFIQFLLYISAGFLLNPFFAAFFIFLHNSLEDSFNPVNSAFFQGFIPSETRATLGSLRATILGAAAFLGATLSGYLVESTSGRLSVVFLSVFIIFAMLFYLKIKTPVLPRSKQA